MANRYPEAKWDPFDNGGSFTGGPPKGLLHTTEGSSYAGARSVYASKRVAPHFTVSPEGGRFQVWQHVNIDVASRALRNQSGGVQTNRDHVIQIEIVGRAANALGFPLYLMEGLRRLMRWIEVNAGVPRSATVQFAAYPNGPNVRMSPSQWDGYSGWCGHQHAPENSHLDPGAINISYLLAGEVPQPPEEPEMASMKLVKLATDDPAVYVCDGVTLRHVTSQATFDAMGWKEEEIEVLAPDSPLRRLQRTITP